MGHGRRHAADHRIGRPGRQLRRRAAPAGTRRSAGRQPQGLCPDGASAVAVLAGQRQARRRLTLAHGLSGHPRKHARRTPAGVCFSGVARPCVAHCGLVSFPGEP
ncbi:hypothetical protein CBM2623_A80154 [Cupriavidus taiwanensis]|nr:hypothetical protein CBM2623_A80154 [Cupriavidus taiwanensis]